MGITVLAIGAIAIRHVSNAPPTAVVSRAESTKPTRTDQRILRAKQQIEQLPKAFAGYNQLAAAYMQKARETGDFNFNANADDALNQREATAHAGHDLVSGRGGADGGHAGECRRFGP